MLVNLWRAILAAITAFTVTVSGGASSTINTATTITPTETVAPIATPSSSITPTVQVVARKATNTPTLSPTSLVTPIPTTRRLAPVLSSAPTNVLTPQTTTTISPTTAPSLKPNAVIVISDANWKFSMNPPSDWLNASFNDSSWISTQAPSAGQCPVNVIQPNQLIGENGAIPMSVSNPNWAGETGYFRKMFNLGFTPSSSTLRTLHDDDGDIYINGHLVYSDHDGLVNRFAGDTGIRTATIDPKVFIQGQNIVGVVGIDSAGGCQSVQVEIIVNP